MECDTDGGWEVMEEAEDSDDGESKGCVVSVSENRVMVGDCVLLVSLLRLSAVSVGRSTDPTV
jgi:hypothetical protein